MGLGEFRSSQGVLVFFFPGRKGRIHTNANDDATHTEMQKHTHTSTCARTHTLTDAFVRTNTYERTHLHTHTQTHARHTHTQDAINIAQTHGHADLGDTFQDMMQHTRMNCADQMCIPARALRDMKWCPCTHSGVPTRDTSRTAVRG